MSDCIMDKPPMMLIVSFSFFYCFNNLNHLLSCKELWFVIMDPTWTLMLICKALRTLLRLSFNAYVQSSLYFQVMYRA
jgi:hypothetical protein